MSREPAIGFPERSLPLPGSASGVIGSLTCPPTRAYVTGVVLRICETASGPRHTCGLIEWWHE